MKKSLFYTLFTVAMFSATTVCTAASILYPVVVNGRWGFVNKSGETVINPQFDRAEVFAEGLAPVKMGRWGYVDASGKVVINPQFDKADVFSEGLAAVKLGGGGPAPYDPRPFAPFGGGGRYGYINPEGKFIINPQFDDAGPFSGGLAAVKMGHWGFVDKTGKVVINPQFDEA
ncbi:MAG TPA: WG repeat-containing protein, partial [Verrucomicrobiae bacterium]